MLEPTEKRILIVDNEEEFAKEIASLLTKRNIECDVAFNTDTARELLNTGFYAGCFIDIMLADSKITWYANTKLSNDGLLLAKEINAKGIATKFVLLSGGFYDMKIGNYLNLNKGEIDLKEILLLAQGMCK